MQLSSISWCSHAHVAATCGGVTRPIWRISLSSAIGIMLRFLASLWEVSHPPGGRSLSPLGADPGVPPGLSVSGFSRPALVSLVLPDLTVMLSVSVSIRTIEH